MDIYDEYALERLSIDNATLIKRQYIISNGEKLYLDLDEADLYVNSIEGRPVVIDSTTIPANFKMAILAIWGDTPTFVEQPIEL